MLLGKGSPFATLDEAQITALCAEAFAQRSWEGKRILASIPDNTRTAPIGAPEAA